jgi:hypothetical protein
MDMKTMEKLEDGFCKVLQNYAERGMKSPDDVETAKAALSGMVKMKMLEEMERYDNERSGRSYYDDDAGMSNMRSYRRRDSMGRYADGGNMSYRRYHDGGYDGGMSGHDMRQQLERMMEEADSERERQALRAAMQKL